MLKKTTIEKNINIEPAVIHDSSPLYIDFEDKNMDNPNMIEELVRNISNLDKEGHEEIYMTIRSFKPQTFFASNSIDTRFNIYGLNCKERNEVDRIVTMCKHDIERKKVFEDASYIHQSNIKTLNTQLITDIDDTLVESINPTEVEKIREMLKMNTK
jgi:hypothetical protein